MPGGVRQGLAHHDVDGGLHVLGVFPPDAVDAVLADRGRVEQRSRLLSSRVVVCYVMGLALFSQASYEEVMRMDPVLICCPRWVH